MASLSVRSIDVGYGFTKFVRTVENGDIRCDAFPSLAAVTGNRQLAEALGQRRDTVTVRIDGVSYEVGPDAPLAAGRFREDNAHDDFCETPAYLALVRGALHYMDVKHLELLVVGLPVSTFSAKREKLRQRLLGPHELPGRVVEVAEVLVLAQPHGALGSWGLSRARYQDVRRRTTLVVDCGHRTFDWIVAQGFRVMDALSGAVNRGLRDALAAIAEQVSADVGLPVRALERIDAALRNNHPAMLAGKQVALQPYMAAAEKVADEAVSSLKAAVADALDEIDSILLVGGADWFYAPHLARAFPHHEIERIPNARMANVRGYQMYGMELEASRQRSLKAANV